MRVRVVGRAVRGSQRAVVQAYVVAKTVPFLRLITLPSFFSLGNLVRFPDSQRIPGCGPTNVSLVPRNSPELPMEEMP